MKTFVWADVLRCLFFVNNWGQYIISHLLQYAFHYSIKVVLSIFFYWARFCFWSGPTHLNGLIFNGSFQWDNGICLVRACQSIFGWIHHILFASPVMFENENTVIFCKLKRVNMKGNVTSCSLGSHSQLLSETWFPIKLGKVVGFFSSLVSTEVNKIQIWP